MSHVIYNCYTLYKASKKRTVFITIKWNKTITNDDNEILEKQQIVLFVECCIMQNFLFVDSLLFENQRNLLISWQSPTKLPIEFTMTVIKMRLAKLKKKFRRYFVQ